MASPSTSTPTEPSHESRPVSDAEATERPAGSSDLLPSRLYPAEIVMLPFFWLAPLNLLVLGGATYLDGTTLERYEVEPDGSRWIWYFAPVVLAHLGTLGYRFERRRWFLEWLDISMPAFDRQLQAADPPTNRAVAVLFVFQLALVGFLAVGSPWFLPGALLNALLAPVLVWRDIGSVREFEGVTWGWPRYLHVVASVVPPITFVYLLQRYEHLTYAMLVRLWTVDPESIAVEREELNRLERFGMWIAERVYG